MSDVHAERAPVLQGPSWTPRTRGARSARTSAQRRARPSGRGCKCRVVRLPSRAARPTPDPADPARQLAGALPRATNARAMRKTRLADQRDDVHCMSANSAVTLMKEAVDSAIKHGDIRLDAVWVASLSPPKDTDMQH